MTSGAALAATSGSRTRDGIPLWDGDPGTFIEFSESARLYEQSVAFHKRAQVGPRIASELSGAARRQVMGMPTEWLSFPGGLERLLEHLRQGLGQPRIVEVTEYLGKYFKQSKRRAGESINEYISRKNELYLRAQQAMARIQPVYSSTENTSSGPEAARPPARTWASRRSSMDSQAEASTTADGTGQNAPASYYDDVSWRQPDEDDRDDTWDRYGDTWSWNSGWQGSWEQWDSWSSWGPRASTLPSLPELLPDFVQGWMLLQDANLDATEKGLVQATAGENYGMKNIANALRIHFPDNDLKKRDQGRRQHGFWGEAEEDEIYDEEPHLGLAATETLNEEGFAAWNEAQTEAEGALAAIRHARRTLKEARAKQHAVKLSRQCYRSHNRGPSSGHGPARPRDDSGLTCLKCGKVGHRAANCPQQAAAQLAENETASFTFFADETIPETNMNPSVNVKKFGNESYSMTTTEDFNFYTEDAEDPSNTALSATITTGMAVEQGKAVLDSGATRSIGSVWALEKVMDINRSQTGHTRVLEVNREERPLFSFGNSSSDQCVSTVRMGVTAGNKEGSFKVHALNRGVGPVLLSIEALRTMGAVVDYEADLAVFRKLDPTKIIQLERSSTGHQLLPLTQDLLKDAMGTRVAIPSLREFLETAAKPQSE